MKVATLAAGLCLPAALLSFVQIQSAHAQLAPDADVQFAPTIIQRIGAEFQANKIVRYGQYEPTVAGLSNGNFVVAWEDASETAPDSGFTIRARIFKMHGVAISQTDFHVPSRFDNEQMQAQAIGLRNGRFLLAWADYGQNGGDQTGLAIRGRRFSNAGQPLGQQFTINKVTGGDQYKPVLSHIPSGGYVAAWFDGCFCDGDTGYQIRAQRFGEGGGRAGPESRVNTTVNNTQDFPSAAGLPTGESVVVWQDGSFVAPGDPEAGNNIRARLIGANGRPKGGDFLINNPTLSGEANTPGIASIGQGRYVVVWEHEECCSTFDSNIRAQIMDGTQKIGGEFIVNRTTGGDQHYPKALGLGGGKFLICWVDTGQSSPDFSGNGIRCQVYRMQGVNAVKYGPEFVANNRKPNDQGNEFGFQGAFSLALLKNGNFVAVWEDRSGMNPDNQSSGIRGQVFRVN